MLKWNINPLGLDRQGKFVEAFSLTAVLLKTTTGAFIQRPDGFLHSLGTPVGTSYTCYRMVAANIVSYCVRAAKWWPKACALVPVGCFSISRVMRLGGGGAESSPWSFKQQITTCQALLDAEATSSTTYNL